MRHLDQRTTYLMSRYVNNSCTEEELEELLALVIVRGESGTMEAFLDQELESSEGTEEQVNWDRMLEEILEEKQRRRVRKMAWPRRLVAASLIGLAGLAGWFLFDTWRTGAGNKKAGAIAVAGNDVLPGKDGAILTLADGSTIVLDSMGNGSLIAQKGVQAVKLGGRLTYTAGVQDMKAQPMYNTIVTPRGRQFQLILSDGTRVWLNAVSSIRFPTSFTGAERNVQVTGEVYFEVAKNEQMPFRVEAGGVKMEVLGTAFNVNAYSDEAASRTTLAEGSLKVAAGNAVHILRPGQQFVVTSSAARVVEVNVEDVVAWKDGLFQFRESDIRTIMRQVARWYDVEVKYEPGIPQRLFTGDVPRDANITELLKILELSNINFNIEGRTIVVKP